MNSSRGSNAYGQQQYAAQQTYGQNSGADGSSLPSRQSSMQGSAVQEADIGAGYRGHHPSASTHFGGPYGAVYGSTALSSAQQVGPMSDKGAISAALQGRTGYSSGIAGSPMFASADYISSSSHGYGPKSDQLSSGKLSDYSIVDRRHYDLQSEVTRRYTDSVGLGHQLQPEIYDRIDQASLLRQQQLLKSQSIQSASPLDGGARPADYLAARGAPIRHSAQDLSVYGGRLDADPRTLSMLSGLPYDGQHQASSILGAAPRRNADDLMYAAQGSATSGYGVSLPPGRDYGNAKGLHVTSRESDYPSSLLSRGGGLGGSRMEERKDDRGTFRRELEIKEEERRRDHVRVREERERDRDRERERERERERRDKDRERERKRVPEIRRERTPPRITREQPGSTLGKEEKSLGRDLQRHDSQQRRHSPVKEKRREYVCKVYPSCLVDVERDYLSVSKRYPRLFVSPDFTKAVVNWPKENQNISFGTPVSFEHDLVEVESLSVKKEASVQSVAESREPRTGATIWNAKVILMSGISKDALEELSSNKNYEDRIPHINNILRFSFLRKDRAFMAIGGPQGIVDGGDSSVDDSSLIKTAISYTKDITQLDLQNCQQWNRFLEIHYNRLGKDGLFSHKEITVLYIPDLSECLPSLEAWRDQLLAHKKAIAEREQRLAAQKNKKSVEKNTVKGGQSIKKSDKDADPSKTVKVEGKLITPVKEEKKESDGTPSKQPIDGKNIEGGGEMPQENVKDPEKKDEVEGGDDEKALEKKGTEGTPIVQGTEAKKPGKKKIVKKVVKLKKAGEEVTISTNSQKCDVDKQGASDTTVNPDGTTVDPSGVKTFTKKKVVKKVPAGKTPQKEDKDLTSNDTQDVLKLEKPVEGQEHGKDNASVQQVAVKTSGKKKIIKRVPKRKASLVGSSSVGADGKKDEDNDEKKVVLEGSDDEKMKEQAASAEKVTVEEKKMVKKTNTKPESIKTSDGKKEAANSVGEKDEKLDREKKGLDDKKDSSAKKESNTSKEKSSGKDSPHLNKDKVKNANEKKGKDEKDDSRYKLSKIVKEKGKAEEPPKYPGLVLQTKSSKDSKIRSMSLSLDALLDYNDKDIDESTFELSLFAEALYEMLQYQMGCRLLTFLQKLRLNFVKKRDQRKRECDENPVKQVKPSKKKLKITEATPMDEESTKDANSNSNHKELNKDDPIIDGRGESKMDDEADDYDPEEDIDDDQEMEAEFDQHDKPKEARNEDEPAASEVKVEKGVSETNIKTEESALGDKTDEIIAGKEDKSNLAAKEAEVDRETNKKPVKEEGIVDKELLQAFRFFDRNRLGYIKVEDLRSIIHNLGKFLSHRDVKELVQSGLIESNTARDNRILYNKLVKLSKCDI
ncbi:protein SHORT ROOT IN SALT MEDIUM 1-like isoform X2 [Papaver somniferum]|uniref:protein SHORT ROOT IN SALT MEDIUM 1-like isoform X2 n=1 Tax=Papaver somniferum TaxID=3469 RepID=UPI000E6F7FD0|nr:protein SHORT ROOT IN SALT MEDIUM 1-like isoform X2 [Papaver somniferum]